MGIPSVLHPPFLFTEDFQPVAIAASPSQPDHTFRFDAGDLDARNVIAKQPVEDFYVGMDFSTELATGELIEAVVSITDTGPSVSGSVALAQIINGDTVVWRVFGGTDNSTTTIAVTVMTNLVQTRVLKGRICLASEITEP